MRSSLEEIWSLIKFVINGVKETASIRQSRIVVDEEDIGKPNLPSEILNSHHIFGQCSFRKHQIMVE